MDRYIDENTKRQLYAESMGHCMNPNCRKELFRTNGDIIEKAHIDPYCKTADNSFENLVILCPNCHTDFDKNNAFTPEEVLEWKKIRREEIDRVFNKEFKSFDDLRREVVPLLQENQRIFQSYYLNNNKVLWDKFEVKILCNNKKLRILLSNNMDLFQKNKDEEISNYSCIQKFIMHIDEFEATRGDDEKVREILFPPEIDSIFGITPVEDTLLPFTESLEKLIEVLKSQNRFKKVMLGVDRPYIQFIEDGKTIEVYLDDSPRLRQLYYGYHCFRKVNVRLQSLNFVLKYIRQRGIQYRFVNESCLREIIIDKTHFLFVYEYCLSKADIMQICPPTDVVVVNLHNWNGEGCISKEAYEIAETMGVTLLTTEAFQKYIGRLSYKHNRMD